MRILGIDPGIGGTGFAILELLHGKLQLKHSGTISPRRQVCENRLKQIYTELCKIINEYSPDAVAIEDTFFAKNAKSAFILGAAHGVAQLSAEMHSLPVITYTPTAVKVAVVGFGRATKDQIKEMVFRILKLPQQIASEHEADAIAIAICHAHSAKWPRQ